MKETTQSESCAEKMCLMHFWHNRQKDDADLPNEKSNDKTNPLKISHAMERKIQKRPLKKHMNNVVPEGVSMPILCNMLAKRSWKIATNIPYTVNRRIDGVRVRLASWGVKDDEE